MTGALANSLFASHSAFLGCELNLARVPLRFFSRKLEFSRTRVRPLRTACSFSSDNSVPSTLDRPLGPVRKKPVEARYGIRVEKNLTAARKTELGIEDWLVWETAPFSDFYRWDVDEIVYISSGSVNVTPEGCRDTAVFTAGDLVHFPKWLKAEVEFEGDYRQQYIFRAYGDD